MHTDDIPIPEPCPVQWETMSGDDRTRYCSQCELHVHDLSARTEAEAKDLLTQPDICVQYTSDANGALSFRPSRRQMLRGLAAAAVVSVLPLPAHAGQTAAEGSSLVARFKAWWFGEAESGAELGGTGEPTQQDTGLIEEPKRPVRTGGKPVRRTPPKAPVTPPPQRMRGLVVIDTPPKPPVTTP